LPSRTLIIEGGNGNYIEGKLHGADKIAGRVAKELGFGLCEVPANWGAFGRKAGPIRNRQMLDLKPDLVIAFHDNLTESRGTADTVREAKRRGIPVEVIGHATF
jgi:hypothetical protein